MPRSITITLTFLFAISLAVSCGKGPKYKTKKDKKAKISHHVIHQPNATYKDDDVIIWKTPKRKDRAFLLKPGTRIEVTDTVDGEKHGGSGINNKVKDPKDREGYVPKKYCKAVMK